MDESSFEFDSDQLAEASRRFPPQPLAPSEPHPHSDVSYLRQGSEFGRHAWDEAGRL